MNRLEKTRELVRHLQDAGNKILDAQGVIIEISEAGKIDPELNVAFDKVLAYLHRVEQQVKDLKAQTS